MCIMALGKRKRLRKLADDDNDVSVSTVTDVVVASNVSHSDDADGDDGNDKNAIAIMSPSSETKKDRKLIALRLIGVCFLIAILSGFATYSSVLDDFIKSYREQYNLVVHGTINYCSRALNPKDLFGRWHLYGQDMAIDRLETIVRQHNNLTGVAIVGSTGIGKTYLINMLRSYYPWKDNVQHYVWSMYGDGSDADFQRTVKFLNQLSICGQNLIVIDDLTVKDMEFVIRYQEMASQLIRDNIHSIKLIIVYVFNVPRYSEEAHNSYLGNLRKFQHLKNILTVNFVELTSFDVENCVRQMASNLNVKLRDVQIRKIVNSIDIPKTGCKNVPAKITKLLGSNLN